MQLKVSHKLDYGVEGTKILADSAPYLFNRVAFAIY